MYKEDKVKKLHDELLEILKIIKNICDRNNIEYYLIGGTLLGAVRHKGFIPWDDDVDIGLKRKDYEKLIEILPDQLPNNFKMVHYSNDKNIHVHFLKVVNLNKYIVEKVGEGKKEKNNIYIDIFPLDYIPTNMFLRNVYNISVKMAETRMRLARLNEIETFESSNKKKKMFFDLIKKLNLSKFFDYKKEVVRFDKKISKYKNYTKSKLVCNVLGGNGILREKVEEEVFNYIEDYNFETEKFSSIKNYDVFLKALYGDYMKLPPKEKQVCKHIIDVVD